MPHGTWQTTGSGDGAKAIAGIGVVAVIGALAWEAAKSAARALGDILVIGGTAVVALAAGIGLTLLAVRLQGRRRTRAVIYDAKAVQPQLLWRPNPQASPLPRREAIAPAPQVVVNIDAALLAGFLREARQQPVIQAIPADAEEVQR